MISTNALSVFLLHHHLNGPGNKNMCSIQDVMRARFTAADKFKRVCEDFTNLAILTNISTPGEIQLTFGHVDVGNKSLGKSVVAFSLAGYLSSPSVISFNIDIAFASDGDKIRLPIAEVLLCTAAGDLARSKKNRDWNSRNAVLLPPFLTEATILHGKSDACKLLKSFARSITKWESDAYSSSEADEASDDDSVVIIEAAEAKEKPGKAKQASAEMAAAKTLATITDDCDNVLALLQAVAVESPRVLAAPLYLRAEKHTRLVPTMERHKRTQAAHAGPTRPPGSHGRPYRCVNTAAYSRSAPSRRRRTAR